MALRPTQPAPAHVPTPAGMRPVATPPGMMVPPPAMPDQRYQARAMRIRPPSTLSGASSHAQRETAKQFQHHKPKRVGAKSVLLAMVIAAVTLGAGFSLRYLEPAWWLAAAAIGLMPAISLTSTRFFSPTCSSNDFMTIFCISSTE